MQVWMFANLHMFTLHIGYRPYCFTYQTFRLSQEMFVVSSHSKTKEIFRDLKDYISISSLMMIWLQKYIFKTRTMRWESRISDDDLDYHMGWDVDNNGDFTILIIINSPVTSSTLTGDQLTAGWTCPRNVMAHYIPLTSRVGTQFVWSCSCPWSVVGLHS